MNHRQRILIIISILILGGTLVSTTAWSGEKLTEGSKWVVVGKIDVAPRKSTLYFQDGKLTMPITGDKYAAWCGMNFKTKDQQQRTVEKGSFEITSVRYFSDAQTDSLTSYKTEMKVKSAEYPDVYRIVCGNWDDNTGDYLTIKQMRQAMQGVMELQLKGAN